MTKLPEKSVLDGSKQPKTTTGEMKDSLGKIRDYLNELLGDNSADKEAARLALGIDLSSLASKPDVDQALFSKADQALVDEALSEKADKDDLNALEEAIAKRGTPVGSIEFFAMATPPAGYLKADGSAVGRQTYPDLFSAIGTTFGVGNGETTFNLPDLIDRFAEGSHSPGRKLEAGLPNISGGMSPTGLASVSNTYGAFYNELSTITDYRSDVREGYGVRWGFNASRSSSVYGASQTVQPAALTLLPCIKAFDVVTNPGLIDVTGLANELAGKLDKLIGGVAVKYINETFNDGLNWYRKWSDGWIEQGGVINGVGSYGKVFINFQIPFSERIKMCFSQIDWGFEQNWFEGTFNADARAVTDISGAPTDVTLTGCAFQKFSKRNWYACGY